MMLSRIIGAALIVLCVVSSTAFTLADNDTTFKVIVHPRNPTTIISREFLRQAFLKRETTWNRGETLRPIDLDARFAVRGDFTRVIIKKTPAQLKSYWSQQIFSGKGVPPREARTTAELITYVLEHPGAIGYLPAGVDTHGAKVIEVR